jgi:hypothetical protein
MPTLLLTLLSMTVAVVIVALIYARSAFDEPSNGSCHASSTPGETATRSTRRIPALLPVLTPVVLICGCGTSEVEWFHLQ